MNVPHKESVARLVTKEDLAVFKDNNLFFSSMQNAFSHELAHNLIGILETNHEIAVKLSDIRTFDVPHINAVEYKQQLEWTTITKCKDCKHRPKIAEGHDANDYTNSGFALDFPNDFKCPCRCEDPYYSWMPDDNWFCANGERKNETD
ncbi:MAG: hypothetical protein J6U54_05290 [Clostridiales bacterium]|nr:hypothetical protein [Clostridiales bacterium]